MSVQEEEASLVTVACKDYSLLMLLQFTGWKEWRDNAR